MKNIKNKIKKIITVSVLSLIVVCATAPAVKASMTIIGNRQYNATKGYRSHTKVTAYDSKGYAMRLTVSAKIGNVSTQKKGYGEVVANTNYISSAKPAYHGYGIGENVTCTWQSN